MGILSIDTNSQLLADVRDYGYDCLRCGHAISGEVGQIDGVWFHKACAMDFLIRTRGVRHILGCAWDDTLYRVTLCGLIWALNEFVGSSHISPADFSVEADDDVCVDCMAVYGELWELAAEKGVTA